VGFDKEAIRWYMIKDCVLFRESQTMDLPKLATGHSITLDLDHIIEDPGPFCMSFGFDLDPLIRSIREFGLINVPIVVKKGKGRVGVVSGYRRILALKHLQVEKVPCRDVSDSGLSTLQLLLLNLHDNRVTRIFNDVEKAMILTRLVPHVPRQEIIKEYLPLLDLPSRESTLELFLNIDGLPHFGKEQLAKGALSVRAIRALLEVEPGLRAELLKRILNLKLTFNQQVKFIEMTVDICLRDHINTSELFNQTPFTGIMENEKLNFPQKAKAFLELLRSIRFPSLTHSEKSFRKSISALGLPQGTRISHPPFFEGADYLLEVPFKNGKQLKERIRALDNLDGVETLGDPWQEEEV
jgi:ParB-like chromosome segregation protein Spo0J